MKIEKAFTLAEVLITLGIIGIVAAMTLPVVMTKVDEIVLKNQFKKTYSLLSQALNKARADLDYSPACYSRKFAKYSTKCEESSRNELGVCTQSVLSDGSPLPADHWGALGECNPIMWDAVLKNLKVIKACETSGFSQGCIPEYRGREKIAQDGYDKKPSDEGYVEDYGEKAIAGCFAWTTSQFKNAPAYVIADGTIITFAYGSQKKSVYNVAVDVNGKKGPNKLGYDLFAFKIQNPDSKGRTSGVQYELVEADCFSVDVGGKNTSDMIKEIYKK